MALLFSFFLTMDVAHGSVLFFFLTMDVAHGSVVSGSVVSGFQPDEYNHPHQAESLQHRR